MCEVMETEYALVINERSEERKERRRGELFITIKHKQKIDGIVSSLKRSLKRKLCILLHCCKYLVGDIHGKDGDVFSEGPFPKSFREIQILPSSLCKA